MVGVVSPSGTTTEPSLVVVTAWAVAPARVVDVVDAFLRFAACFRAVGLEVVVASDTESGDSRVSCVVLGPTLTLSVAARARAHEHDQRKRGAGDETVAYPRGGHAFEPTPAAGP